MIVDIFALVDDDPIVLKRPIMPFATKRNAAQNTFATSFRIPVFIKYAPQTTGWQSNSWYFSNDMIITAILIGGKRYQRDTDAPANTAPQLGMYNIHVENDVTYACISLDYTTLVQYEPIEFIAVSAVKYSKYGTKEANGDPNPPMILNVPDIKKRADALKYARFSFESIKVNFIKDKQSILLYGGEMALSLWHKDNANAAAKDYDLGKFIINHIDYNEDTVELSGIDFRYALNIKYPTETFSRDRSNAYPDGLPHLEEKYINKVIPAVLGHGNGIPGICLNGLQVYTDNSFTTTINRYDFQFPPGWIGAPIKIEVKANNNTFTGGLNANDSWIEVYPGLGNPWYNSMYKYEHPEATKPTFDSKTGIVKIWWEQCIANKQRGNAPNEVRMYAKWPYAAMDEAIRELLRKTSDASLLSGFSGEFDGLAEIGLYMDESKSIFEWVEKLQASNVIGGQLMLIDNFLRFRLENPNRERKIIIHQTDVLNHKTLNVATADEFLYSGWDISYKKSWADDEEGEGHNIGPNYRYPTADVLNAEDLTVKLNYTPGTAANPTAPKNQLFDTSFLSKRVKIISDMINPPIGSGLRHEITGLEVPMSSEYLKLLIYDVVGYLPETLENNGYAIQPIDWLIYEKRINLKRETIQFTLVERRKTNDW